MVSNRQADFSPATRRTIAARAGWRCSIPGCGRVTVGPGPTPGTATSVGRAAHIYSSSIQGPRGAGNLTPEQRASVSNGIWLCATHADLIDKNDGSGYSPQLLAAWRDLHEARVAWELDGVTAPFGWVESLTVHRAPLMAGTEIRFGKCTLSFGKNGSGKTAVLEWLSGPIHPARLARWAAEDWETQSGGIEVSVRYHHPNPVEMRCSAENGVITFSSDGRVVPIPVAPFQLVEVRRAPLGSRTVAEELAYWTGEHAALLPGILQALTSSAMSFFEDARVEQGNVLVRRRGARSFSRYESLSGGEQTRLRFGLAIAAAGAKAAQAPTILLLDDVLDLADTETAHAVALHLQRPEHRFQTIVTCYDDRFLAPDIAWEIILVHRDGAEPVQTEFVPSSFGGDDE
jgi:energy-coupling factor transporter ATP-binding protein EcfA2